METDLFPVRIFSDKYFSFESDLFGYIHVFSDNIFFGKKSLSICKVFSDNLFISVAHGEMSNALSSELCWVYCTHIHELIYTKSRIKKCCTYIQEVTYTKSDIQKNVISREKNST